MYGDEHDADARRIVDELPPSANVIGIGEHAHGDVVSWRWRTAIVRELVRRGHRIILLCENVDYYIKGLRRKRVKFEAFNTRPSRGDFPSFMPFMIPFSNLCQEHLLAVREITKLVQNRVYGIDAQVIKYPVLKKRGGSYVARKIAEVDAIRRWAAAGPTADNGNLRNVLNADIVAAIARDHPDHTVLYFAQNEHVGVSCSLMRKNSEYRTEGSLLRKWLGTRYIAIATYSPLMWAFWGTQRPERFDDDGRGHPDADEVIHTEKGRLAMAMPMESMYTTADFDYTLCTARATKRPFRLTPEDLRTSL